MTRTALALVALAVALAGCGGQAAPAPPAADFGIEQPGFQPRPERLDGVDLDQVGDGTVGVGDVQVIKWASPKQIRDAMRHTPGDDLTQRELRISKALEREGAADADD